MGGKIAQLAAWLALAYS